MYPVTIVTLTILTSDSDPACRKTPKRGVEKLFRPKTGLYNVTQCTFSQTVPSPPPSANKSGFYIIKESFIEKIHTMGFDPDLEQIIYIAQHENLVVKIKEKVTNYRACVQETPGIVFKKNNNGVFDNLESIPSGQNHAKNFVYSHTVN